MADKPEIVEEETPESKGAETSNPAIISEDFQQSVHDFLANCESMECLDYIADAVSKKRIDMSKEGETDFDTEGMPAE